MSGATEKSNYYLSFGLNKVDGVVPNSFLNSGTMQFNYSNDVLKRLTVDTRVGLYMGKGNMSQGASISGGGRSFTRQLISYNPLLNGELEDDDPEIGESNPFSWITGFEDKIDEKRLNASFTLTWSFTDHFKYVMRAGGNYRNKARSQWYDAETKKGTFTNGYLALSHLEKTSYTFDNLLIYNNRFNEHSRLNFTVGITYDGNDAVNTIYEVGQFPISVLREKSPQLGELVLTPYSSLGFEDNILSYLGRFTYTLNDRYAFNGSIRVDQSSKFREGNRTGYFPSASFAWTATNENFLANADAVSNLKLRLSWGQVGNQAILPYQTYSNYGAVFYSDDNNSSVLGVAPVNIANQDLTWETTTQTNFGVDFGFIKSRLTGSVDVYHKKTTDLLINSPTPTSTGFNSFLINQGGLENKGVEFLMNAIIVDSKNLSWSVGGNISVNKSKITDLSELPPSDIYINGELTTVSYYLGRNVSTGTNFKAPANAFIEGQPIGVFWGYQTDGIYRDQATADAGPTFEGVPNKAGDIIFIDQDGDGNVSTIDNTVIGDPNADFAYGINTNLTYKNFSLDMLFNGVSGNEILNGNLLIENQAVGSEKNIRPGAYYDAWTIDNPDGAYSRIGSIPGSEDPNDRLIEDGSYFRLANITLSYDINFHKKKNIFQLVKFYVSGNNVFTITNYSGYDPELTSFLNEGTIIGVDWVGTPNVSSFVLGVNLKF
jgi:TonB-linked SusC/RagA family outer membrane protein